MESFYDLPSDLRVVSINCWGLKWISKHRQARLTEIGRQLALASPPPQIVGLQEVWTQEDYLAIRELTKQILPYGKFYWSGIFGGGLAILSKWPIIESGMYRYSLNGRPAAFWRGDWYVGKGVASARIRLGPGSKDVVEVFCTHLHAPYEREPNDSYICHRTAQAWEIAKMMRHAAERGHMVLGLGDFNMIPLSLAHKLIEAHAPVRDAWRIVFPNSAVGSAENQAEKARGIPIPTARQCLDQHGATCDSKFNTWRWSKQMQKDLDKGRDSYIDPDSPDSKAKRLDYIFFASNAGSTGYTWSTASIKVGMTARHPTLNCSLSDHFSIEATLHRGGASSAQTHSDEILHQPLDISTYDTILSMIATYSQRERRQRSWRMRHFWTQIGVSCACLVAVWWSPHNGVAFALMLLTTLGLTAGVLDGQLGFLFVKSELRALKEFEYEILTARGEAVRVQERKKKLEDGASVV